MNSIRPKKNSRGQTILGVLIAMAVFAILAHSVFTLITSSFELVGFNRARITARHLAQEKIEFIRNLPYDLVGTVSGIPAGPLPQTEVIERNKLAFTIKTAVVYVDDPFDGTQGGSPNDLLAADYKRVRVEVSWSGQAASRRNPVVFLTDISPKGVETTAGGGTLSILVFDANGEPVPQADVHVVQTETSPSVDITFQTGDNGRYIVPGAPVCVSCYQITVTKPGYSTERTYSTVEIDNPNKPHQTILGGQLTEISFAIDRVSSLSISTLKSREELFEIYPGVSLLIRGDKTIGTDNSENPVYKYVSTLTTNEAGLVSVPSLEWDNYHITIPSAQNLDISGSNPVLPVSILPNTAVSSKIALSPHSTDSLLLSFVDNTTSVQVASVSATLSDGVGFNETKLSGLAGDADFGQVFFANLTKKQYTLVATVSGYIDFSGLITVLNKTQETVQLSPNP